MLPETIFLLCASMPARWLIGACINSQQGKMNYKPEAIKVAIDQTD
jgi:hypothetical protein